MHCFVILYKGLRHPRILGCVCVCARACMRPRTSPSIKRADCSRVVGTQVIGGFSMAGLKVPNSWAVQGSAVLPMSALNMN